MFSWWKQVVNVFTADEAPQLEIIKEIKNTNINIKSKPTIRIKIEMQISIYQILIRIMRFCTCFQILIR